MHKLASCEDQLVNIYLCSFADHMGDYELAESDHISVVAITCIESECKVAITFQAAV